MNEGTVYLIAQPTIARNGELPDLTPLAKHGAVKVLVQAGEAPGNNPQMVLDLIEKRLADFDPATDFIAWAGGDTLAAVLTGVILERMELADIPWLRFDRDIDPDTHRRLKRGSYTPIRIALDLGPDEAQYEMFPPTSTTKGATA